MGGEYFDNILESIGEVLEQTDMVTRYLLFFACCLSAMFGVSIQAVCQIIDDVQTNDMSFYIVATADHTFAYPKQSIDEKEKIFLKDGECLLSKTVDGSLAGDWIPVYAKPGHNEYWVKKRDIRQSRECKDAYALYATIYAQVKPILENRTEYDIDDDEFYNDIMRELNEWMSIHINELIESETNTIRIIIDLCKSNAMIKAKKAAA